MANIFKDTQINGNLNVTEDVQIGDMSLTEKLSELNTKLIELMTPSVYTTATTEAIDAHNFTTVTFTFDKTYLHEPIVMIDDLATAYQIIPTITQLTPTSCKIKIYASCASGTIAAGRKVRIRVYGISV